MAVIFFMSFFTDLPFCLQHVINDIRYPLEMHIIHKNKKYETVAEALNHKDGLTVLVSECGLKQLQSFQKKNLYFPLGILLPN
jgi:hypothetical protein